MDSSVTKVMFVCVLPFFSVLKSKGGPNAIVRGVFPLRDQSNGPVLARLPCNLHILHAVIANSRMGKKGGKKGGVREEKSKVERVSSQLHKQNTQ